MIRSRIESQCSIEIAADRDNRGAVIEDRGAEIEDRGALIEDRAVNVAEMEDRGAVTEDLCSGDPR